MRRIGELLLLAMLLCLPLVLASLITLMAMHLGGVRPHPVRNAPPGTHQGMRSSNTAHLPCAAPPPPAPAGIQPRAQVAAATLGRSARLDVTSPPASGRRLAPHPHGGGHSQEQYLATTPSLDVRKGDG
jgi:hypothetical protein